MNLAFSDEEFNALRSVDAHLGAARLGLKEVADVLAVGLKVNLFIAGQFGKMTKVRRNLAEAKGPLFFFF